MQRLQFELTVPNQLTLLRIVLTPVFAWFLLSDNPIFRQISLGIFIIAALTDWYDGWIARRMGYTSRWGKFLDPLADKILSSATLLAYVSLNLVAKGYSSYPNRVTVMDCAFVVVRCTLWSAAPCIGVGNIITMPGLFVALGANSPSKSAIVVPLLYAALALAR